MRTRLLPLLAAPALLVGSVALAAPAPILIRSAEPAKVIAETLSQLAESAWEVSDRGCKFEGAAKLSTEGNPLKAYQLAFDNRRVDASYNKRGVELECSKGKCLTLRSLSRKRDRFGRLLASGSSRDVASVSIPMITRKSKPLAEAIDANRIRCLQPPPPAPPAANPAVVSDMNQALLKLNAFNGVAGDWIGNPLTCELTLDVDEPGEDWTFDLRDVQIHSNHPDIDVACNGNTSCIQGTQGNTRSEMEIYDGNLLSYGVRTAVEELQHTCQTALGQP